MRGLQAVWPWLQWDTPPRDAGAVGGGSAAPAVFPVCGVVACCIKHVAVAFKSLFKAPLFYCTNGHSALLG